MLGYLQQSFNDLGHVQQKDHLPITWLLQQPTQKSSPSIAGSLKCKTPPTAHSLPCRRHLAMAASLRGCSSRGSASPCRPHATAADPPRSAPCSSPWTRTRSSAPPSPLRRTKGRASRTDEDEVLVGFGAALHAVEQFVHQIQRWHVL